MRKKPLLRFLLQLAVVVVTVILSVWRTVSKLTQRITALEADFMRLHEQIATEITRLATAVEKQNGYVRQHGEELAALRERLSVEESRTKRDREDARRSREL